MSINWEDPIVKKLLSAYQAKLIPNNIDNIVYRVCYKLGEDRPGIEVVVIPNEED